MNAGAGATPAPTRWERHPADLARLLASLTGLALVLGLTLAEPRAATGISRDLVQLVGWLPTTVKVAAAGIAQVAAVLVPVALLLVLLRRGSLRLVLVLAVAGAVPALAATALQGWLDDTAPSVVLDDLDTKSWFTGAAFPSPAYLAALAGVTTVVVPGLRPAWRRAAWWILAGAAALRLLTAVAVPLHLGATLLLGIAVGSAVLLAVGAPARRSRLGDSGAAAAAGGHPLRWIEPTSDGAWHDAELDDGSRVTVRVTDRDERDADLLFRLLIAVQRRGLGAERPGWSPERLVQHEALATLLAAQADVTVPDVVGVGAIKDGLAVLLVRDRKSTPLDELEPGALDDGMLAAMWHEVEALHAARIAHRRLHVGSLRAELGAASNGGVVVTNFSQAQLGADDILLAADVAELLVSLALRIGPERAAASAVGLGPARLSATLPLLQPLALSPVTRRELRTDRRAGRALLEDLRRHVQEAADVEAYELAELQRLSIGRIVGLLGGALLVYVVLSFASNWSEIADALGEADLSRLPVVLILTATTYLAGALSLQGAVLRPLPLAQTTEVMLGQSFLNRFTPANAGGMALRARYLQRNGVELPVAAASIGLTSAASGAMQMLFIAVFLTWSGRGGGLHFDIPDASVLAVVLVLLGAAAGLVWLTPLRRRVVDNRLVASARHSLGELRSLASDPAKVALLFGGAGLGKLVTILAFVQSARAFGVDLGFAEMGALYLTANTVASAAPTPGGVGAVEAALVAVLTGSGVDSAIALSTVLVFRLATYWLPVPAAWLALRHLRSTDAV